MFEKERAGDRCHRPGTGKTVRTPDGCSDGDCADQEGAPACLSWTNPGKIGWLDKVRGLTVNKDYEDSIGRPLPLLDDDHESIRNQTERTISEAC